MDHCGRRIARRQRERNRTKEREDETSGINEVGGRGEEEEVTQMSHTTAEEEVAQIKREDWGKRCQKQKKNAAKRKSQRGGQNTTGRVQHMLGHDGSRWGGRENQKGYQNDLGNN